MRKNNVILVWLFLLAAVVTSCKEDEETDYSNILGASEATWKSSESIAFDVTSADYSFVAAGAWTVSSSQPDWCEVSPASGNAGQSTLHLTLQPNDTGAERTAIIIIEFTQGYQSDRFIVRQQPEPQEALEGLPVNLKIHDCLANYYLWNGEYNQMQHNLNYPYSSDSENYMTTTLMSMATNTLDKKLYGSQYRIYSYISRYAGTRTHSATRATGLINHGLEPEATLSYGFASLMPVELQSGGMGLAVETLYPNSPAATAGLHRGDMIMEVNGTALTGSNYYTYLVNLLYPSSTTETTLTLLSLTDGSTRSAGVTPATLLPTPVLATDVYEVGGTRIGYLNYASFDAAYDNDVLNAFVSLKNEGIDELILDLRYNGGGHVISANLIATLIAGDAARDQTFSYYRYNDERMANVELTEQNTGFPYDETVGKFRESFDYDDYYGIAPGQYGLNLRRLYVLTTSGTASASELVINALNGIGVQVVTVGETSNGKNVGMEGTSFSDGSYSYEMYPITFQTYNANDYSIPSTGVVPDIAVSDWSSYNGYVDFGLTEPLIAAAIADITGIDTTTPQAVTRSAGLSMRPLSVDESKMPVRRLSGMLVLPKDDEGVAER